MAGDESGFRIASAYVEIDPKLADDFSSNAQAKIDAATSDLSATAKLTADDTDLKAKVAEASGEVSDFGSKSGTAKLGADATGVDETVASADAKVDDFGGKSETARLGADASGVDETVASADAKVDEYGSKTGTARLGVDASGVDEGVGSADAKVDEYGAKDEKARVGVDDGDSNAKLDELIAKLSEISKTWNAKLNIDTSGSGSGGLSSLFSGGLFSPAGIGGMALGGGALAPALPGALTGAGAAAGVLGLAIAGTSTALSDYSAKSAAASTSSKQLGSSATSSASQIRTAQQAVSAAETQAAHDSVTSAEAIKTAQQGVQQAETQAAHDAVTSAESIKNAQQGVATATQQASQNQISAEEQLKAAQYSEEQAQQALTAARQQAILTLQSLTNASADAALSVSQDQLNLQQAQLTASQTNASSTATALQKEQADLAVKEAEQALKEAIENRTNSAKASQTADKEGVNGNPAVLAAEHAQQQAKQGVADAQRNLANVEKAGAQAIAQAERSLADAIRSASWQRVADAQNVAKAQQGLSDASRNSSWTQQADAKNVSNAQFALKAAYATAGTAAKGSYNSSAQAAATYAKAMAALTPAGRQFVTTIIGMEGALHKLEGVAQAALLPGLTALVKGIQSDMPLISGEITKMGGLLSKGFSAIGKEMESSGFKKDLQDLFDEGNKFISILGPALNKFVLAFVDMGVKGGPALTGFAKMLAGILGGVDDLMKNLSGFSKAGGSIMITLGKAIGDLGGPLGTVIGVLNSAIAPLLKGALPLFKSLLDQIARIVKAAQPGLVGIGRALGQMLTALTPVLPSLGTLVVQMVKLVEAAIMPLLPLLPQLIPPMVQLATQGMQPMMLILTRLTPLISILAQAIADVLMVTLPPLTAALVLVDGAIQTIETDFISAVTSVSSIKNAWNDVASFTTSIWNGIASYFTTWWDTEVSNVTSTLKTVESLLSKAWDAVTSAIKTAWNAIKSWFSTWWDDLHSAWSTAVGKVENVLSGAWNSVEKTVHTVFGRVKSFFSGFWGDLHQGFDTAVGKVKTAWDKIENIMKTPVNWVISNVYDKLIVRFWNDIAGPVGLKPLHRLASGGKLPGYGGGDIVPALLEPGETVVSKEHSKALAPAFRAAGVPGYAAGGIVSDIGGKVSSVWDGITGAIGETFHKVIGSIEHDLREGLALPMKAAGKVINAAASHVPGSSGMADAMKKAPAALWAGATKMVMSTTAGSGSGAGGTGKYTGHYGAGVSQWRPDVLKVLGMLSEPASLAGQVLYQMQTESGGDPNAINLSDCVTLDYVILTKRGWLPHDQVRPGDETIGYNPETGRSEWTQITRVVRYEDAEVWRIGNRHWHADVTPNHRWWSDTVTTGRPESRKARPEFVRTDSFKSGNRLRLAAAADTDGIPCLSLEDVRIIAWLQGDGTVSPYTVKPQICPECAWVPGDYRGRIGDQLANAVAVHRAKKHAVTKDLTQGEFAGYDGRIWQSKPEQIVKLRALLAAVPHTESVRERDVPAHHLPHHVFSLRREFVTDLLKRSQVMETGPEAFVRALSPDQRAAWLDSMIDAEGHRQAVPSAGNRRGGSGEFVRIAQINGPVQEAIKLAVYLEGYRPTFSALNAEQRGFKPSGQVGMARPHIAPSMFNPHEVLERQPVWCVTTELGTWTARGGDALPFLTGNSNAAAGDPSRGLLHSSRRS